MIYTWHGVKERDSQQQQKQQQIWTSNEKNGCDQDKTLTILHTQAPPKPLIADSLDAKCFVTQYITNSTPLICLFSFTSSSEHFPNKNVSALMTKLCIFFFFSLTFVFQLVVLDFTRSKFHSWQRQALLLL